MEVEWLTSTKHEQNIVKTKSYLSRWYNSVDMTPVLRRLKEQCLRLA